MGPRMLLQETYLFIIWLLTLCKVYALYKGLCVYDFTRNIYAFRRYCYESLIARVLCMYPM